MLQLRSPSVRGPIVNTTRWKPWLPTCMRLVAEAAAVLHVSPRTVRRWLQRGYLPGQKLGTTWPVGEIDARLASQDYLATSWLGRDKKGKGADTKLEPIPIDLLALLRQLGDTLIAVGNQMAEAVPRQGQVFLT